MIILVINGPNLNMLGQRDKEHYGEKTLDEIKQMLQNRVNELDISVKLKFFQSNCEGALIDFIQQNRESDGLIINPGALSHYSYALADALRDFPGRKAEVHLSDISRREDWRAKSVTAEACDRIIMGKKEKGYLEALEWMVKSIK
ncbi:MAG: type II 3-dehydroquinate dehydratase [Patescibacteria group bacterium]